MRSLPNLIADVEAVKKFTAPTYKAGDWVVTAGGTVDKAQKVVELTFQDSSTDLHGSSVTYGIWNNSGNNFSHSPTSYTVQTLGPILRLATPEEIKAGKVLGAGDRMLAAAAADMRRALSIPVSDGTHLEINVGQSQGLTTKEIKTIESLHRTGRRPHGWAGSTLVTIGGKERQIRTVPRSQMMGLLAHALEDVRAAGKRAEGLNGQLFDLEQKNVLAQEHAKQSVDTVKRLSEQLAAQEITFDAIWYALNRLEFKDDNKITARPKIPELAKSVVAERDAFRARNLTRPSRIIWTIIGAASVGLVWAVAWIR